MAGYQNEIFVLLGLTVLRSKTGLLELAAQQRPF